jgi:hypothetical protein
MLNAYERRGGAGSACMHTRARGRSVGEKEVWREMVVVVVAVVVIHGLL